MRSARPRTITVLTALACLFATGNARGDVSFFTDIPGANSTVAMPFALDIFNNAGVATRVNVTNIVGGGGPGADDAAAKAAKIRAAINTQAPVYGATGTMNQVHINSTNRVKLVSDPTKERLEKGKGGDFYRASLGNSGTSPTGKDPFNLTSIVQFGIEDPINPMDTFIAMVNPTNTMTVDQVFMSLDNQLNTHGISATYDSTSRILSLNNPVPPSDFVDFGNTDTGFDISADIAVVSEPSALLLLASGLVGFLGYRGHRAATAVNPPPPGHNWFDRRVTNQLGGVALIISARRRTCAAGGRFIAGGAGLDDVGLQEGLAAGFDKRRRRRPRGRGRRDDRGLASHHAGHACRTAITQARDLDLRRLSRCRREQPTGPLRLRRTEYC